MRCRKGLVGQSQMRARVSNNSSVRLSGQGDLPTRRVDFMNLGFGRPVFCDSLANIHLIEWGKMKDSQVLIIYKYWRMLFGGICSPSMQRTTVYSESEVESMQAVNTITKSTVKAVQQFRSSNWIIKTSYIIKKLTDNGMG